VPVRALRPRVARQWGADRRRPRGSRRKCHLPRGADPHYVVAWIAP